MQKIPYNLKKTTIITLTVWVVVIGLFFLQYYFIESKENNDIVVSIMMLLFLFIAIPATLLTIIEWVRFFISLTNIKWLAHFMPYLILVMFIYGVGIVIDSLITKEIAYLPFKMVVFIHVIVAIYAMYVYGTRFIFCLIGRYCEKRNILLPEWSAVILSILIAGCLYFIIRFIVEKIPLVEWIF